MANKLKLKDFKTYEENPFKANLIENSGNQLTIHKKLVSDEKEFTMDEDNSKHKFKVKNGNYELYWNDAQPFTKFFTSEYALSRTLKCSYNASQLMMFMAHHLKPNSDVVRVTYTDFLKAIGKKTKDLFYKAATELCELEIIARLDTNTFFVNPAIFMNGKRDGLLPDPYVVYAEKMSAANPQKGFKSFDRQPNIN